MGQDIGKSIGDNVPGAKAAADYLKPVQNYLRGKLGINQPKATPSAPAAPVASTAKQAPGKVTPAAATNTTPKNTIVKPAASPATAPAPAAASAAAPVKTDTKPLMGNKGDFKNFQSFNKGATYGQYLNTIRGLTAKTGGANDPGKIAKTQKQVWNPNDIKVPSASSTAPKLGGSDQKVGDTTQTPIQQHDSVPSTDRAAANRQMFDMNRKSPGSTADLANQVDKANATKPTTAMTKPAAPTSELGSAAAMKSDIEKKKAETPVKPIIRPMQESVQVGANKYRIV